MAPAPIPLMPPFCFCSARSAVGPRNNWIASCTSVGTDRYKVAMRIGITTNQAGGRRLQKLRTFRDNLSCPVAAESSGYTLLPYYPPKVLPFPFLIPTRAYSIPYFVPFQVLSDSLAQFPLIEVLAAKWRGSQTPMRSHVLLQKCRLAHPKLTFYLISPSFFLHT